LTPAQLAGGRALADRGNSALYAMLDDHGVDEPENGVLVVGLHGVLCRNEIDEKRSNSRRLLKGGWPCGRLEKV